MSESAIRQNGKEGEVLSPIESGSYPIGSEDLKVKQRSPVVKGCFIATAAMGSELHPHVQLLRDFRDNILLRSRYKKSFENLLDHYYQFSPPIARTMQEHVLLKTVLRFVLVFPIVFGIKMILPLVSVMLGIERDAKRRKAKVSS